MSTPTPNRVCVLGLGHIGLPTAALLANNGIDVTGVDVDQNRLSLISDGEDPLNEHSLNEILKPAILGGRLEVASLPRDADAFIICVQTPVDDNHQADLSAIRSATESIVPYIKPGDIVIVESTCPPGSTKDTVSPILTQSGLTIGRDIHLAYCPERVLPGNVISELLHNDRIIGGFDSPSAERARDIFSIFVRGQLFLTDIPTAEIVKIAENTYRDVNIALSNQLAAISDSIGIDVWEVIRLANQHPRVELLNPGPGVGGHCIPVDPWFLVQENPDLTQLIRVAREINDRQPSMVVSTVSGLVRLERHPKIAVMGLAYKGDVGDARESPSHTVVKELLELDYQVVSYDPMVDGYDHQVPNIYDACKEIDCLVIMTDHTEFQTIDPRRIRPLVRNASVFDTRNILDIQSWEHCGFDVTVLGAGHLFERTRS